MPDESGPPDKQQPVELIPDHLGESRHEFVSKLAYELWEKRERPLGSAEVGWFAAEHAVYASLVASGTITPSVSDSQNIGEKIYRRAQSSLEK